MKAYTPEVASGNTSSAVKVPQVSSIKNSALGNSTPMVTPKMDNPSGSPHTPGVIKSFNTPSQPHLLSGGVGHVQHESRSGGVPHIPMVPA
jgi:hypothetical protein